MPKDSPGLVRLQVEVLEERSLLSVAAALWPSPVSAPAAHQDQGTTSSVGAAPPTTPATSSTAAPAGRGPYAAGAFGRALTTWQQLAQTTPVRDASVADDHPAFAGSSGWWVYVVSEEMRERGLPNALRRDDHTPPASPSPAGLNDFSLPVGGVTVAPGSRLPSVPDRLAPVPIVLARRVAAALDEPERGGQEATLSARTEEPPFGGHRGRLGHTPGFVDFQAAAAAHGQGTAAAFTPALAETRSTPLGFVVAAGETWVVSNWNGALAALAADLRGLAVGQSGLFRSLYRLDSVPQEGEADPFGEVDVFTRALAPPGLLLDALAADAGKLQAGVRSFLGQLDHLGTSLATTPSGVVLSCWVLAVTAAGSACEIVRRQARRRRVPPWAGDPLFTWVPEAAEGP
jgi:hypothetical protein